MSKIGEKVEKPIDFFIVCKRAKLNENVRIFRQLQEADRGFIFG